MSPTLHVVALKLNMYIAMSEEHLYVPWIDFKNDAGYIDEGSWQNQKDTNVSPEGCVMDSC